MRRLVVFFFFPLPAVPLPLRSLRYGSPAVVSHSWPAVWRARKDFIGVRCRQEVGYQSHGPAAELGFAGLRNERKGKLTLRTPVT